MAMLAQPRTEDRTALYAPLDAPEARQTPADYDRLLDDLRWHDRHIELVRGRLILQMPQKLLHQRAVAAVLRAFFAAVGEGLEVTTQGTTEFGEDRLEPDAAIVRFRNFDGERYPQREEIQLAVEVAVSSLVYDRGEKTIYYAEGGVPEYWIVNPVARQIEVYRRPENGRYQDVYLLLPGEQLDALCLPGAEFSVDALLPSVPTDKSEPG